METEQNNQIGKQRVKAFEIGLVCIFSYLVSYFLRKMLGVATPLILEDGIYSKTTIALFSSVYMVLYASGQLFNGILGDYVNSKWMSLTGLSLAAFSVILFPLYDAAWLAVICFGLLGFALSMLRGPLMKIITENTLPNHARTICVFFSCASFAGPFIASLLMLLFSWRWAFYVSGILALFIAAVALVALTLLERRGVISCRPKHKGKVNAREILQVFKVPDFFFYMMIGGIVETSSTSISQWLPTFYTEYLSQTVTFANTAFSVNSFLLGLCPFITLFLFRLTHEKALPIMRVMFSVSIVSFLSLYFARWTWLCLALLFIGMFGISCVSSLLWSIYIPGLGKTGRVSSVNGVLDCSGYLFAALANLVFVWLMENVGWGGTILSWLAVAAFGLVLAIFKREHPEEE